MRFLRFRNWLDDINDSEVITSVYFEEVRRHIGTDAAHVYGGFLATLTSWCEDRNLPYQGVPVSHIKRHITGKGNASKQEVIKAIEAIGYRPKDNNEADALALLELVRKHNKQEKQTTMISIIFLEISKLFKPSFLNLPIPTKLE